MVQLHLMSEHSDAWTINHSLSSKYINDTTLAWQRMSLSISTNLKPRNRQTTDRNKDPAQTIILINQLSSGKGIFLNDMFHVQAMLMIWIDSSYGKSCYDI